MTQNSLTFVNHACFHVRNENTLLLVDPWVEGPVFNNGWSLLDSSTSNAALARELGAHKLRTVIWYSHEHPDHFSIGFIRALKQETLGKVTILFQQTKDKRVVTFLRRNGFEVIECEPGVSVQLDEEMRITVFPYADGDSYCLINSGARSILNMNDCALTDADMVRTVKANIAPLCSKVDVLMTQFGYANWVGNPFEPELRRRAAAEKRHRIRLQMEILRPAVTVPFASFVVFSSEENSYLNDYQNSAYTIRQWSSLSPVTESVRFMKPGDSIDLERDNAASMVKMSYAAVEHWKALGETTRALLPAEAIASAADIQAAFAKHRKAVAANLPWLPYLLEKTGMIKPLLMYIPDLHLIARFSYVSGYSELELGVPYDISMTSSSAAFLFNNEYGFNTTHVNGRFRTTSAGALLRFGRFFMPQNLGRQGYGVSHPLATAGHLAGNVLGRLRRA
ncbi:MAG: MBL fold metallo-hydrolase [Pseudomonadota bacterium]